MKPQIACERCGACHERAPVSSKDDPRLGRWARSSLCDKCEDALLNPKIPGCTCAHFSINGNPYLWDCDANH